MMMAFPNSMRTRVRSCSLEIEMGENFFVFLGEDEERRSSSSSLPLGSFFLADDEKKVVSFLTCF